MHRHVFKNLANLAVLVRVALIFVVIGLLGAGNQPVRLLSLPVLALALVLDGLDGYLARRLGIASEIGAVLDTLGDRITENVLIFYFAYMRVVPLWFALFFLVRSFIADFIRGMNLRSGFTTFAINRSVLGHLLVSSGFSRVIYLLSKFGLFFLGSFMLAITVPVPAMGVVLRFLYWFVFLFSLIRFFLLLRDSRAVLKDGFHAGNG